MDRPRVVKRCRHTAKPIKPEPPVTRTRMSAPPPKMSVERRLQLTKPRQDPVLVGQYGLALLDRPPDPQIRLGPVDASLMRGGIDCVELVDHKCVGLQGAEPVRETGRHE